MIDNTKIVEEGIKLLAAGCSVFTANWERSEQDEVRANGHHKKNVCFPSAWKQYTQEALGPADFTVQAAGRNTLCLVLGKVSGNLHCIDIDAPALYDAFMTKATAAVQCFNERVYTEYTYSGGYHVVYAVSSEVELPGNQKLAKSAEGFDLIETRGEGGIIYTAPTYGYTQKSGSIEQAKARPLSADEFNELIRVASSFNEQPVAEEQAEIDTTDGFDDNISDYDIFAADITSDPRGLEQARKYTEWAVANRSAIEGQGGSNTAMTYFNRICWGFKVSPTDALTICQPWNAACNPPWSRAELMHKIASAWRHRGKTYAFGSAIDAVDYTNMVYKNGVMLRTDKHGKIKADLANARAILQEDATYIDVFKYNELRESLELVRPLGYLQPGTVFDKQPRALMLCDINERYDGLEIPDATLKTAALGIYPSKSFNPFRDYVDSCVWDGTPRVATLLIDCFGCEDNCFTRESITNWLIAAYARQVEPGLKFDNALALTGVEGLGKSRFVQLLFDPLNLRTRGWNKDAMSLTSLVDEDKFVNGTKGKVGVELAEFAGSRRIDMEQLKSALTACSRLFRGAYKEESKEHLLRQVFLVTTNETNWLMSLTGNRRFWIVKATKKNTFDLLTRDYVAQVWGEVKQMYLDRQNQYGVFDSASLLLTPEAEKLAYQEQQETRLEYTWESDVARRLGAVKYYTDIKEVEGGYTLTPVFLVEDKIATKSLQAIIDPEKKFTPRDISNLTSYIVNVLGWERTRGVYNEGTRSRGFSRPADDYNPVFIEADKMPQELLHYSSVYPDRLQGYGTTPKYWDR